MPSSVRRSFETRACTLFVALGVIGIRQFAGRIERIDLARNIVVAGAIVSAVVLGVAETHPRPFRGAPLLVSEIREQFGPRLDDVFASNDPTFQWIVDPKPLRADRTNATGTLLIWNPDLAHAAGARSDSDLVDLGFRQIWVATDAGVTLAVWERVEIPPPPGSG